MMSNSEEADFDDSERDQSINIADIAEVIEEVKNFSMAGSKVWIIFSLRDWRL